MNISYLLLLITGIATFGGSSFIVIATLWSLKNCRITHKDAIFFLFCAGCISFIGLMVIEDMVQHLYL